VSVARYKKSVCELSSQIASDFDRKLRKPLQPNALPFSDQNFENAETQIFKFSRQNIRSF
jgi:hypothetical protein